ncbi:MAG TPA: 30S ribosomal protein S20 [bacterium]|nr:30S ribosomal protein S20 [bacterium]
MAHSKQAIKRLRTSEKKRVANKSRMSRMKTEVKKLMAAVAAGDKDQANAQLPIVCKCIDKASKQHIIHANQASRRKSQVMRVVAAMK